MKPSVIKSCLSVLAALALVVGVAAAPAKATTIGTLAAGSSFSDTISSSGPTFTKDYDFHLDGSATGLTLLATAFGQTSPAEGVDLLKISLFDSAHNLITSASGVPIAFFDSFAQTGIALAAGDYVFNVFGQVTAGKHAFVSVSLAANSVSGVPIPAAGLMLLTGFIALGGLALRRHRLSAGKPADMLA
jgi:hypothetical protein